MSKVFWGLSNVYYALKTQSGYETPVRIYGAVSLTAEPEGDSTNFYADDGIYFTVTTNNGRSGTLTIAKASDQMLVDLLGYVIDDNGMVVEVADAEVPEFALLYDVKNDGSDPTHFVMYDVKLSRASNEHETQEDQADPNTMAFDFTARPIEHTLAGATRKIVGGYIEKSQTNATQYNGWFSAVYTPTKTASSSGSSTPSA